MISKKDILKFVKHVHKRGRGIPDRRLMHPSREWLIGVCLFLVATISGAISNYTLFNTYNNVGQQSYTLDTTIPEYKKVLVNTALTLFRERQSNFDKLKGQHQVVVTPEEVVSESGVTGETASTTNIYIEETIVTDTDETLSASSAENILQTPSDSPGVATSTEL